MTRTTKILGAVVGTTAIALAVCAYALFHGYFDLGRFEVKEAVWSSSREVAMVAERSDNDALGGLAYFVIVGDHLYSSAELRHTYHSNAVIFSALSDGLTVRWQSSAVLIIGCNGAYVDSNDINTQKRRSGNVAISYENIAVR